MATEPPETDEKSLEKLANGDRRALARAITMVESTRKEHRAAANALISRLHRTGPPAMRIGLSGTPGVGKSTFIEALGCLLADRGLKVAVLAVDPSSERSGGAILGDKTRMPRLARHPNAFVRPSPSQTALGGVARRTRAVIELCEGVGYDVILVETVGVGQSETMVADMTDIFMLLLAPAGGDELQGIKRGIMEIADLVVVNKADGDLAQQAMRTAADYAGALRLLRRSAHVPEGFPKALTMSALEETGVADVWDEVAALWTWRQETGVLATTRQNQARLAFRKAFEAGLAEAILSDPAHADAAARSEAEVVSGQASPDGAALALLAEVLGVGKSR